jgi:hypothetical protein
MPVPYFRQKAPSLAMMGYRPIPILPSSKKPLVLDWPHYNFPTGDQERYAYASVGVLCGSGLLVVDADIYNAALASRVMRHCLTRFGLTSHRLGLLPKFALPYRIQQSTGKVASRGYIDPADSKRRVNRLEFLGQGNYLVTHGIHPETQLEYRWPIEDLAQVPIERLEEVAWPEIQEVIRDFETQCVIQGFQAVSSNRQLAQSHRPAWQGQHAADTDKVLAAIAVIPNTDRDYDSWISVGLAIKGALGDTQEGLEAWLDFSAQYEGNDLDTCIAKWDTFHPKTIGAGTLIHLAQEAQRQQAFKLFKPITPEAAAAGAAGDDVAAASLIPPPQVQALDAPTYLAPAGAFNAALGRSGWLVKRVLHQASIYTVTAHASAGKTTLLALLAACIQCGQPFCGVDVKQGQVLYCAADDPYGVLDRLEALAQHGYPAARDILVSAAAFDATSLEAQQQLIQLAQTIGNIRLIVLDTVLYYTPSSVESENDNLALSRFLAQLKELTKLPGKPTILVLCHPRKGALNTADELIPRGGSAVLAASDGNLAIWREDDMVTLHHSAKMRGAFEELTFQLQRDVSTGLLDEDGEAVLTVQAMPMQEEALAELQRQEQSRLQQVLGYLQGQQAGVWMGAPAIELALQLPRRTVQRHLRQLMEARRIRRTGYARATAYQVVGSL